MIFFSSSIIKVIGKHGEEGKCGEKRKRGNRKRCYISINSVCVCNNIYIYGPQKVWLWQPPISPIDPNLGLSSAELPQNSACVACLLGIEATLSIFLPSSLIAPRHTQGSSQFLICRRQSRSLSHPKAAHAGPPRNVCNFKSPVNLKLINPQTVG